MTPEQMKKTVELYRELSTNRITNKDSDMICFAIEEALNMEPEELFNIT